MSKPEPESPGQLRLTFSSERKLFSVTEINSELQKLFSERFSRVWVTGEISGTRVAASGHYYFCLKDAESQIKCVLFRNAARLARMKPQDGLGVALQGNLEVYQSRGEYQIIVERLELFGSGSLQVAFEALKQKLAGEGLFAASAKKALPRFPRRIGLITSPAGAALPDMLQVFARRFPGLHVRLFPAAVQGEGSAEQLTSGVQYFNRLGWADLLILARGGGSLEDLWSFNDEALARAIAASAIPVISAVGHEIDFTIADFVADHRAPTPSAAAEIAICTKESLIGQLFDSQTRLLRSLRFRLLQFSRAVDVLTIGRAEATIHRALSRHKLRLDEADQGLRSAMRQRLVLLDGRFEILQRRLSEMNLPLRFARNRSRRDLLMGRLQQSWHALSSRRWQRLELAIAQVGQLSPVKVLARGYAIVEKPSGEIVHDAARLAVADELKIRLHSGRLRARVSEVEP